MNKSRTANLAGPLAHAQYFWPRCLLRVLILAGSDKLVLSIVISGFSLQRRKFERLENLSNHDDDGNENIPMSIFDDEKQQFRALCTYFFPFLDISQTIVSSTNYAQTFSFFPRRNMTCFAVVWTTWECDDRRSILSSYLWSASSNIIPG